MLASMMWIWIEQLPVSTAREDSLISHANTHVRPRLTMEDLSAHHSFVEGFLSQQNVVDGILFPKVLLPVSSSTASESDPASQLVPSIRKHKIWLEKQIHHHGALLLRGFALRSPKDFNAVVESFGWEETPYIGTAPRTHVTGRVYTANEAPPEAPIFFHHEMALTGNFPSKVLFFCEVAPKEGGQTPILLSHKVTERMEMEYPDFVNSLEDRGLKYTLPLASNEDRSSIIGTGWQGTFKTTDQGEAEKRAGQIGAKLEWLSEGRAKLIIGPSKAMRSFDEGRDRKVWFNNMVGLFNATSDMVTFGDGSWLPGDMVEACERIEEEEAVDMVWEEGDVLILDNLSVMHGRRPCKPPRRVLVAMCK